MIDFHIPALIFFFGTICKSITYIGGRAADSTYIDEILEFDPLTGQWKLVDRMIQARAAHAVSVINFYPWLCI